MIAILLNLARAVDPRGPRAWRSRPASSTSPSSSCALFLLSTAETFADIAEGSLLPRIVPREHLTTANARMSGAFLGVNQLIAPPIGAFLFVAGAAIPFAADAVCFVLGARADQPPRTRDVGGAIRRRTTARREASVENPAPQAQGVLRDIAEGVRWLAAHPAMRTLVITIVAFNVTYGAAWSVLVLYVRDQLGMGEIGYGIITAAAAVGGHPRDRRVRRLTRRFSLGNLMRAGLIIETLTHLSLALTRSPGGRAGDLLHLRGPRVRLGHDGDDRSASDPCRTSSTAGSRGVYRVGIFGGLVVGAPIGGFLARSFGIAAPFWFGFIGSAILVALLWRSFSHIAHDEVAAVRAPLGYSCAQQTIPRSPRHDHRGLRCRRSGVGSGPHRRPAGNGGRPSGGPMAGHPILLMFRTGARTGERRRSILTYSLDGDALVVAGTANGRRSIRRGSEHHEGPERELEAAKRDVRRDGTVHPQWPRVRPPLDQRVEQLPSIRD